MVTKFENQSVEPATQCHCSTEFTQQLYGHTV